MRALSILVVCLLLSRCCGLRSQQLGYSQGLYFYLEYVGSQMRYVIPRESLFASARDSEGKPIVFKYRNYDLYLYKPDYEGEEELVFLFRFHHL